MSTNSDRVWRELGIVAALYAASVAVYVVILYFLYNETPDQSTQDLIKEIPSFLKDSKKFNVRQDIALLIANIVIYTLPMTVSVTMISYFLLQKQFHPYRIIACIIIPFFIFYFIFDREVLAAYMKKYSFEKRSDWLDLTFSIASYYVLKYKIMTAGSVLVGGYAGYKLHEAE